MDDAMDVEASGYGGGSSYAEGTRGGHAYNGGGYRGGEGRGGGWDQQAQQGGRSSSLHSPFTPTPTSTSTSTMPAASPLVVRPFRRGPHGSLPATASSTASSSSSSSFRLGERIGGTLGRLDQAVGGDDEEEGEEGKNGFDLGRLDVGVRMSSRAFAGGFTPGDYSESPSQRALQRAEKVKEQEEKDRTEQYRKLIEATRKSIQSLGQSSSFSSSSSSSPSSFSSFSLQRKPPLQPSSANRGRINTHNMRQTEIARLEVKMGDLASEAAHRVRCGANVERTGLDRS